MREENRGSRIENRKDGENRQGQEKRQRQKQWRSDFRFLIADFRLYKHLRQIGYLRLDF